MPKSMWFSVLLALCVSVVIGCGGSDEGTPALTEPATSSTPEENKNWMEESMKKSGGAVKNVELATEEKE